MTRADEQAWKQGLAVLAAEQDARVAQAEAEYEQKYAEAERNAAEMAAATLRNAESDGEKKLVALRRETDRLVTEEKERWEHAVDAVRGEDMSDALARAMAAVLGERRSPR